MTGGTQFQKDALNELLGSFYNYLDADDNYGPSVRLAYLIGEHNNSISELQAIIANARVHLVNSIRFSIAYARFTESMGESLRYRVEKELPTYQNMRDFLLYVCSKEERDRPFIFGKITDNVDAFTHMIVKAQDPSFDPHEQCFRRNARCASASSEINFEFNSILRELAGSIGSFRINSEKMMDLLIRSRSIE